MNNTEHYTPTKSNRPLDAWDYLATAGLILCIVAALTAAALEYFDILTK